MRATSIGTLNLLAAIFSLGSFTPCGLAAERALVPIGRHESAQVRNRADLDQLFRVSEAAQADVGQWLARVKPGDLEPGSTVELFMTTRTEHRFKSVARQFQTHLAAHPEDAEGLQFWRQIESDWVRLVEAIRRWETARAENSRDPEPWTELAHFFHHNGTPSSAIHCLENALVLDPQRADLHRDYATAVFLFRKDAQAIYGLSEQAIMDRALRGFRKALLCDPASFELACELARTISVIRPLRVEDALASWRHALALAQGPIEREEAWLHLARIEVKTGRFSDARHHLTSVASAANSELRDRLSVALARAEARASAPAAPTPNE